MGGIVHSVENAFHHVGHAVEQALPAIGAIAGVVLAPVTGGLSLAALAAYAGSAYAGYELGKGGQTLAEGKGWGAARGDILQGAVGALGVYGGSLLSGAGKAAGAAGAADSATSTAATLGGSAGAAGTADATSAFLGGPSYAAGMSGTVGSAGSGMSAAYLGSIASAPADVAAAGGGLSSSYLGSAAAAAPTATAAAPTATAAAQPSMTDQLISGAKGLYQDYSQLSGIIKPAMGVYNAYASNKQAGQLQQMAQQASVQANPLQPYQAQAAQQLAALQANPGLVTQTPEYKAMYETQLAAAQRQLAARGMTDSGAATSVAAQIAAQVQNQIYQQQVQNLTALSTTGAATGAQIGLQGNEAAMSLRNSGLNQLASSLGGYTLPGKAPAAA